MPATHRDGRPRPYTLPPVWNFSILSKLRSRRAVDQMNQGSPIGCCWCAYSAFIKLGDSSSRILMRARISFAVKGDCGWTVEGQSVSTMSGLLDCGDMESSCARYAGRNPDRGREALSPRGVLYAWTWSEMARKTRPGARFQPAVSARFGCRLRLWLCLPRRLSRK